MKILTGIFLFLSFLSFGQGREVTFQIEKQYLNFPVELKSGKNRMDFKIQGKDITYSVIRLFEGGDIDYWVFKDVSAYKGKKITIKFERQAKGIDLIYQSDKFAGEDSLYREKYRPQINFTSRRGWNNDPNGLVYHNGEYHLFYQHNPYEHNWENMHWGHAVSRDLIHWDELNDALFPDESGTMFSGSAVVDKNNKAGFGKDAIVAFYTAHRFKPSTNETQCMAYSTDKGRTFTKYEGNPLIDNSKQIGSPNVRDPKVFWYDEGQHGVMVLYEDNYVAIYNSDNLKDWVCQSRTVGFYECPEFFELAVDGNPDNKKWVMTGASGDYLIGTFDGKTFTPEAGKYYYTSGAHYAAQTFNNTPDGRRIQIGWGRVIEHPGMPFKSQMNFPTELKLKTLREGVRLVSNPIKELKLLHGKSYKWTNLSTSEANEKLAGIKSDCLHIKFDVEIAKGVYFKMLSKGNLIADYNMSNGKFINVKYQTEDINSQRIEVEIILDKTSFQTFVDGGKLTVAGQLKNVNNEQKLTFGNFWTGDLRIHTLEVTELESIWSKQ